MEESTVEKIHNIQEVAPEAENKGNNQQEVIYINIHGYVQNNHTQGMGYQQSLPQNFQGKTFIFSQAHNQQPKSNQQYVLQLLRLVRKMSWKNLNIMMQ